MHYLPAFLSCAFIVFGLACQPKSDPKKIIANAIEAHGGQDYDGKHISFSFRDRDYDVYLNSGQFTYERMWEDSIGNVHDVLTNEGFTRKVNGKEMVLSAEDETIYTNSLNSVVYFALLPQPLTDPAVNATYLGADTINSEQYYKVRVTFDQAGGGTDFDDVFVYWFHQDKHTMDYLAYEFHVNGGGTRFREAYNVREVNGLRFADFINYTDTLHQFPLEEYNIQFTSQQVQELSRIDLENVQVEVIEQSAIATGQN